MKKYLWSKNPGTGSHTFWQNGQKIRTVPGDRIEATSEELGSFAIEYTCMGEITDKGLVRSEKPPTEDELMEKDEENSSQLVLIERGGGYYDVANPDNLDKPVNSKGLRREEALEQFGLVDPEIIKKERKREE